MLTGSWMIAALRSMCFMEAQLMRFQRVIIIATEIETVLVMF